MSSLTYESNVTAGNNCQNSDMANISINCHSRYPDNESSLSRKLKTRFFEHTFISVFQMRLQVQNPST
jgi:hypothetical protein